MKLPRINPRGIQGPPGPIGLRVPAINEIAEAVGQFGQTLTSAARKLSADELREVRFEAALQAKEDRATRSSLLRRSLFNLRDQAFEIESGFLDDLAPETLAKRANKSLVDASNNFGSQIENQEDREQYNLQAQALVNSLTTSARVIGIRKMRDKGLADGLELSNETLTRFAADPSISDDEFAGGVDAYHQFNTQLEEAGLIDKTERQKLNAVFDDKLGGVVQQQDETLAVESGSHFRMLQHLIRVQNGFYKIAPENVPSVIEAAIARQSKFLNALEIKEGKRATAREKEFQIALDLQDTGKASELLGRPVLEIEFQINMKGMALEAFHKGIIKEPSTVNAIEAEEEEAFDFSIDTNKATITEGILKATTVAEIDTIIEELISPQAKLIFGQSKNGPEARRELLKEAAAKKDKFVTEGASDDDESLKKEIQLAESALNAKRETGIFGAFGTKATNEKIALMKRLLHLKVKQGQRPFDALADLEKHFAKTPAKVAAEGGTIQEIFARIPFDARVDLLLQSAPLTESDYDDEELKELIRFRHQFIEKTQTFIGIAEQERLDLEEKARKEKEAEENSFFNQLKKLIPQ